MAADKSKSNREGPELIPPGATQRAPDRTPRRGGPPATDRDDRYAAGTPGGGTEVGGLAGENVGGGAPDDAEDLHTAMATDTDVEEKDPGPPYSGSSGGAVGGSPAEGRSKGGHTHGGLRPGGDHRG